MRFCLVLAFLCMAIAAHAQDIVSISAPEAFTRESAGAAKPAKLRLTRNGSTEDLTVTVRVQGTATFGTDYTFGSNVVAAGGGDFTVLIPSGDRTADIRVIAISDVVIEQAETVTVSVLSSGSTYIAAPDFAATAYVQDDDMTAGWAVVDETAQEEFEGGRPDESTYALQFLAVPGAVGNPVNFTRDVRLRFGDGTALFKTDYIATYMYRHAGQPSGQTMQSLRTTNFDFTYGWSVIAASDKGVSVVPFSAPGFGTLSVDDIIQFGEDAENQYLVVDLDLIAGLLTISPPLQVAISKDVLIRNNLGMLIDSDGASQGNTIPGGYQGLDFTYTPAFDAIPEGSENVAVTLWASNDYLLTDPQRMESAIGDDDLLVSIDWAANAARPATSGGVGTTGSAVVTLASSAPKDIYIPYRITGTAASGTDFEALPGSITIPQGSNSATIQIVPLSGAVGLRTVVITLLDTKDYEPLGSASGDINPSATVNIIDQIGTVSVTAAGDDGKAKESDSGSTAVPGQFTVSINRVAGMTDPVSVVYEISGSATAGSDYTALTGSVTIPAGQDTVIIPVTVLDDTEVEGTEDVTLTIQSAAGYSVNPTNANASVQISDDEPVIQVTITGSLAEPSGTATVTISYPTTALNRAISVPYTITGTATPGSDFSGLSATAEIPAGSNTTSFQITVQDDAIAEGPETIIVTAVARSAYSLDPSAFAASVIIADDEPTLGVFAVPGGAGAGAEPSTPASVYVRLVNASGAPSTSLASRNVTFSFTVNDGTAVAGSDYTLPGGVVTGTGSILSGESFATVSIAVLDDALPEADETGTVTLLASAGYNLSPLVTSVPFTILDNEASIEVSSVTNAAEPATAGAVVVRNRGGVLTTAPLTVRYAISGTARAGTDYVGLTGSVTIPIGSSQVAIPIVPIDNSTVDSARSLTITLRTSSSYNISGTGIGTVSIADDDASGGGGGGSTEDSAGSGSSCGAGSGVALLLGFGSLAFLARRRRSGER